MGSLCSALRIPQSPALGARHMNPLGCEAVGSGCERSSSPTSRLTALQAGPLSWRCRRTPGMPCLVTVLPRSLLLPFSFDSAEARHLARPEPGMHRENGTPRVGLHAQHPPPWGQPLRRRRDMGGQPGCAKRKAGRKGRLCGASRTWSSSCPRMVGGIQLSDEVLRGGRWEGPGHPSLLRISWSPAIFMDARDPPRTALPPTGLTCTAGRLATHPVVVSPWHCSPRPASCTSPSPTSSAH